MRMKRIALVLSIPVVLLVISCQLPVLALEPTVVVQQYSVYPDSFMPGDAGTVIITIRNSALVTPLAEGTSTEQSSGTQGSTDTYTGMSQGYYSSGTTQNVTTEQSSQTTSEQSTYYAPMNANITNVNLYGNAQFSVESPAYEDLGRIGPGDTVTFTFVVRASEDVSDGIYFLIFRLESDNPDVYTNYQIPLKVDTSTLRLILSNQPSEISQDPFDLVFDVVNIRSSDVSMVYIDSQSDSLSFSPTEYYIGAMDSGEMFTAQLTSSYSGAGGQQSASFSIHYKNGDNWHEGETLNLVVNAVSTDETTGLDIPMPGLLLMAAILLLAIAYFVIRRSRRKK